MDLNLEVHEKIIKGLSINNSPCTGILYGIETRSKLLILGLEQNEATLLHHLPVGLDICGYFQIGDQLDNSKLIEINEKYILKTPVIITFNNTINIQILHNGELEKVEYEIVNDEKVYAHFMFIRSTGSLPINCEFTPQAVSACFHSLISQSNEDDPKIIFKLHKSQVFFFKNSVSGLESDSSNVFELYKDLHQSSGDDSVKKKKFQSISKPITLNFDLLSKLTTDKNRDSTTNHAPVCILNRNSTTALDMVAKMDILAMVPNDKQATELYSVLVQSLIRYMSLLEDTLRSLKKTSQTIRFKAFHFLPEDLAHFVTILYNEEQPEGEMKSFRQILHTKLLLDLNAPRFKQANQYLFDMENSSNGPLVNPHEGIRNTNNGGEIALIRGKYLYYHYCQNNMDDNGWGCAYRSLQTLASWFKLQGYVARDVPTFQEIQKCLVDIKDKPASFLGSRQWIGSTEVSFVLNSLLGIDCKILFVSSGEEMSTKGPELVYHFKTQGSPIMIGGGVLAHTILGVDYNNSTGKLRFLILDPHYTGGEDLHTIQSKGWCGWKGLEFWDKKAYYNMCLPQVPKGV